MQKLTKEMKILLFTPILSLVLAFAAFFAIGIALKVTDAHAYTGMLPMLIAAVLLPICSLFMVNHFTKKDSSQRLEWSTGFVAIFLSYLTFVLVTNFLENII